MPDPGLSFEQELIKAAIQAAIPTLILVFGGRWVINYFELSRKHREQKIELARFVREQQYEALQELYSLFAEFMRLYRQINSADTDLSEHQTKQSILNQCIATEARVDAVILRIASEFTHNNRGALEERLANLRQSVQLWRECVRDEKPLPFHFSSQTDYIRFKHSFASTATYMASLIYQRLEPAEVQAEESKKLLEDIFSNKWEKHGAHVDKL